MKIEDNDILSDIVVRYWNKPDFEGLADAMHLACHACWQADEELSEEFRMLCDIASEKIYNTGF